MPNDKKIIIIGSFADRGIILNDLVKMGNDLGATTVIFPNICHVTVLFANLLDNAIDASKKCKHDRRIFLRIHKFKDYVVIKMINTMAQTLEISDNKLISTKREHTGLGISILTDLVNKYCGNMNYSYTDKEFETKIILSTNNRI